MKRFLLFLTVATVCLATAGCSDNHDDLWDAVGDLDNRVTAVEDAVRSANGELSALKTLIEALERKLTVDSVTAADGGYVIAFSDGTSVSIADGASASVPAISVREEEGVYYWTLDGEYILDDNGDKVRASATDGVKGDKGEDGTTPRLRIDPATLEWEYSLDNGATWTPTGVKAQGADGRDGDSFFRSVDASADDCVVFTLADGTSFTLPKSSALTLVILREGTATEYFSASESRSFEVETKGVADHFTTAPDGWQATFDGTTLTVAAPAGENLYASAGGEVAIFATSVGGASRIAKLPVALGAARPEYELRVLTFEDGDYLGGTSGYWSSLIDPVQYGGELLYGSSAYDMDAEYEWSDTGNTFLSSGICGDDDYDMWSYMMGGCAVSNYVLADISEGDYTTQLSVLPSSNGKGGRNGSENFCVCFDGSSIMGMHPSLTFADGECRVIDHMYVAPTCYTLHSLVIGDSFSGGAAGADDWFKVVATGFDADDEEIADAHPEIYLFRDGTPVEGWTKWSLAELGAVSRVEFECQGSMTGAYGLNTPAYFAFDDVAVRF